MNEKYDVFISYRRDGGESTAKILHDKLENLGYRVFFDVESLRSGNFNTALYSVIDNCKDFLLVLSPGALNRCKNENDWVRLEIERALGQGLNIVPVMLRGFSFPQELPPSIDEVRYMSGIEASYNFFDAFIDKLREFLVSGSPIASRRKLKRLLIGAVLIAILGIFLFFVVGLVVGSRSDSDPGSEPVSSSQQDNSNGGDSTSAANVAKYEYVDNGKYEYVYNGDNSVSITKYIGDYNVNVVQIPEKLDGKSVTVIESNAFENYENLITIAFPDSVIEIKENAFYNCPKLEQIRITSLCNLSENAFNNCKQTYEIVRTYAYENVANGDNSTSLTKCPVGYTVNVNVPKELGGKIVTIIESNAFENGEKLKTVVFPDSVTEIKENAFCNCPNLTTITVSKDCKVSENAFNNCGKVNIERRN